MLHLCAPVIYLYVYYSVLSRSGSTAHLVVFFGGIIPLSILFPISLTKTTKDIP